MSEARNMLAETAQKALAAGSWAQVVDSGLCNVMVGESAGGFGGGWEDALPVFRAAGASAVALPVVETIIANRVLAVCGLAIDDAPASFVTQADGEVKKENRFTGVLSAIPWDDLAERILGRAQRKDAAYLLVLPRTGAKARSERDNLAGEPRGSLTFEDAAIELVPWAESERHGFTQMGALARTCQIAGAMETMLAMTVEHAKTRQQFGRALGQFQAIQQQLAVFASETARQLAQQRLRHAGQRIAATQSFEIGAAKLRANRAVDVAASVAHQVHGAIGITKEHALHRYTQRLWSWKSEFGNDRHWAEELGASVTARGADNLWADLTAPSNRAETRSQPAG